MTQQDWIAEREAIRARVDDLTFKIRQMRTDAVPNDERIFRDVLSELCDTILRLLAKSEEDEREGVELESRLSEALVAIQEENRRARHAETELALREQRISELERRLRIPFGKFPCAQCGGPHEFDTSIPSVTWNEVIRAKALPEYLCTTCIVREFVRAGRGFTATLWNEEFNGVKVEFVVNGQNANDAALVNEENNRFRNELAALRRANDAIPDLFNLLQRDDSGQWKFNSLSRDWSELQKVLKQLEAARQSGTAK